MVCAVGVLWAFIAGLGLHSAWLAAIAGGTLALVVTLTGLVIWVRDTRRARRRCTGTPPMVSPPERPARRAPQGS